MTDHEVKQNQEVYKFQNNHKRLQLARRRKIVLSSKDFRDMEKKVMVKNPEECVDMQKQNTGR